MRLEKFKIILVLFLLAAFIMPSAVIAATKGKILDLSDEISSKKDELDDLESKLNTYKKKIDTARKKATTLKNQIDLTDTQIKKTGIEIQKTELQIDKINLEVSAINTEISKIKQKMELQKQVMTYHLRELQRLDSKSSLEIILLNSSFSEFFNELQYLKNLQDDLGRSLKGLSDLHLKLEGKQKELKNKKISNLNLKNSLEDKKGKLESQKTAKTVLIGQTFATESKFQALLFEAQKEKKELDEEISKLENQIRQKLEQNDLFPYGGNVLLTWPIPKNKITAYFHDPDYPFRYLFEHSGIDIRAKQGTTIKAPAPGYVLKVRNQNSWQKYNYIVLAHSGGISTVYIHLSQVYVKPDTYVSRGQVIGSTGGTPRTRGAGYFTTGPHLHFEVRQNGIPVNPLNFLVNI